ncbi:MAG TPA: PASTA domain-containing protein, partial [Kineosporiaceae bacterium]|nr:PASTA domain-containing protein [Kineosporiaceae bacterium]
KVMDFGIARAIADASSAMTQTQAVIGTAQYLSPEQARGETVDARSDLYSAGCLLYELLTGRPPFVADSPVAVAYQHVREEPQPPSVHNPAVPENVDRIVLHALAKDRETRYQTADEFRADIEAALAGRPVSAYAAGAAAGAATTQFLGAPGGGTRTMQQPVGDPYGTAAVGGAAAGVGGGMLPGAPMDDDFYGPRREPEPGRGRGWSYALLALGVLLVAGLVAFTISKISGSGNDVKRASIPTVQGLDVDKAVSQLTAAGFTNIDHSQTKADDQVAEGAVISQDPTAGQTVPVTDKITLVVSTGPDAVNVPNVQGLDQNAATAQLQQAGLQIGAVTTVDGTSKKDTVVSTKPAIGSSVAKGTKVNLQIASGRVQLGNLKGQTQDQAVAAIQKLGLTAVVKTRPADPGEQVGVVVKQEPGKGKVDVGSSVEITVTTEPTSPPTPTPSPSDSASPSASPTPSP